MIVLTDKRTGFYYLLKDKVAVLADDYETIPKELSQNPDIDTFDYINEDERVCLTAILNSGITNVRYENSPYCIDREDILTLAPNLSSYYYALAKLGKCGTDVLWDEEIYLLVNLNGKKRFLKSNINGEKLYIAFIDKTKAETFLTNMNEKNGKDMGYYPIRFMLDKRYRYLILDDTPFMNNGRGKSNNYILSKEEA